MLQATFILSIALCANVKAYCVLDDEVAFGDRNQHRALSSFEESIYSPEEIQYPLSSGASKKLLNVDLNVHSKPSGKIADDSYWEFLTSDQLPSRSPSNVQLGSQKQPTYTIVQSDSYSPRRSSLEAITVKERETIHLPHEKSVNVQVRGQQNPSYSILGEKYQPREVIVNERVKLPSVAVKEKSYNVQAGSQEEPVYRILQREGYQPKHPRGSVSIKERQTIHLPLQKSIDVQIRDKKELPYSVLSADNYPPGTVIVNEQAQVAESRQPTYSIVRNGDNYQPGTVIVNEQTQDSILPNRRTFNVQIAEPQQSAYALLESKSGHQNLAAIAIKERGRIHLPGGRVVNVEDPRYSLGSKKVVVNENIQLPSIAVKERESLQFPIGGGQKDSRYAFVSGSSYQPESVGLSDIEALHSLSAILKEHLGNEHHGIKRIVPRHSDDDLC